MGKLADAEEKFNDVDVVRKIVRDLFDDMKASIEMQNFDIASGHGNNMEDITFYFVRKQSIRATFSDPVTGAGGRVDKPPFELTIYTAKGVTKSELKQYLLKFIEKHKEK